MNLNLITSRENLVDSIARMQSFFSIYREKEIPRDDMLDVYRALIWVLENFELDDGFKSYIQGNLNAVSRYSHDVRQLKSVIQEIINSYDKDTTKGGEVEFALRSLMVTIREGHLRRRAVSEQAMLTTLKNFLRGIIDAYNALRFNVFVSFTSKDREVAELLKEQLAHSSTKVKILDIEEQLIGGSLDWLLDEMYEGDSFLLILSQNSTSLFEPSDKFAIKQGTFDRGIILLPIRIDECEIPSILKDQEVIDIAGRRKEEFNKLIHIIGAVPNVDLTSVDPQRFEALVKDLLIKEGFTTSVDVVGGDVGYDLLVEYSNAGTLESEPVGVTAIQVKHYPKSKADLMALTQFAASLKRSANIRKGILVTNSSLTSTAREWLEHLNKAEEVSISVIEGVEFKELLLRHQDLIQKYFPTA